MSSADRVRINLSGSVQYPWSWQCTFPDEDSYMGECGESSFATSRLSAEQAHRIHVHEKHEEP